MASALAWVFVAVTVLTAGVLVRVLARPGALSAARVWALTALAPILLSITGALTARSGAERHLEPNRPHTLTFTWAEQGQARTLTATFGSADAACLARAVRLNAKGAYRVTDTRGRPRTLRVTDGSTVRGDLPSEEVTNALVLTDRLSCRPTR
ncbi:hypothetical protein [Deinococcus maricopensis]|uniref:Uncharacterized protein n=1 Tax=Deinococcus maricopensis (strain DSM 21211 / LMG 22137 / NRRL B-23946 / LB-34) TaxID=709986 RepID=E8U5X4_DEIML|nr:hypothetical protein [Deinococcus maricopensis]ADV66463.1 hypothetical protein Deima_0808 [Deinococcus maricopensis DSM 21211]